MLPARVADLHWTHEAPARVTETGVLSARASCAQHPARRVEVVPIGAHALRVVRDRQLHLLQQVGAPVVRAAGATPADDSARAAWREAQRPRRNASETDVCAGRDAARETHEPDVLHETAHHICLRQVQRARVDPQLRDQSSVTWTVLQRMWDRNRWRWSWRRGVPRCPRSGTCRARRAQQWTAGACRFGSRSSAPPWWPTAARSACRRRTPAPCLSARALPSSEHTNIEARTTRSVICSYGFNQLAY